jgi:hypothetical protein
MFPGRRSPSSPSLELIPGLGVLRHDRRRDQVIRVGRMPRIDTFQIGVEVLPRQRDVDGAGEPRPAA